MAKTLDLPQPSIVKQNVIFKRLPCSKVSPWNSHPKRYWKIDSAKFLSWYEDAKAKNADLILINYTKDESVDELKAMKVIFMNADKINTSDKLLTREKYVTFVRAMEEKYNIIT